MDGIPNTPQDLLKQLDKELEDLWGILDNARRNFERANKEVKQYKSIIDSMTKQIDAKEQYINSVKNWRKV